MGSQSQSLEFGCAQRLGGVTHTHRRNLLWHPARTHTTPTATTKSTIPILRLCQSSQMPTPCRQNKSDSVLPQTILSFRHDHANLSLEVRAANHLFRLQTPLSIGLGGETWSTGFGVTPPLPPLPLLQYRLVTPLFQRQIMRQLTPMQPISKRKGCLGSRSRRWRRDQRLLRWWMKVEGRS